MNPSDQNSPQNGNNHQNGSAINLNPNRSVLPSTATPSANAVPSSPAPGTAGAAPQASTPGASHSDYFLGVPSSSSYQGFVHQASSDAKPIILADNIGGASPAPTQPGVVPNPVLPGAGQTTHTSTDPLHIQKS